MELDVQFYLKDTPELPRIGTIFLSRGTPVLIDEAYSTPTDPIPPTEVDRMTLLPPIPQSDTACALRRHAIKVGFPLPQ